MKILAIRGRNLASLAGDFEVDLQKAPLSGEGLFAITGLTGSGKSTLLDAMCLALFDKTPRLQKGQGSVVGRDEEDKKRQAGNSDPRALLRNGTVDGFAEVDFLGVDERVYRSRWSVRRSRGKVTGRLQNSQLELWDVATEQRLDSDKKGETLEAIEARLGLGFEQFRRSVLLPQGEFAAFLKASEQERGELLERMTGTEIYREISVAAFERAKRERQELERLEGRLAVLELLDDAQVAALEEELLAARSAEGGLAAALAVSGQAVAWHARRAELAQAEAAAQAVLSRARDAAEALAPVEAELAAVSAVAALRPLLAARDRAHGVAQASQQAEASLRTQLSEADLSAQQAVQAAQQADARLASARARQESMGEALRQAEVLDAELASLGRAVAAALAENREAEAARSSAEQQVRTLEAEQGVAQASSQQAAVWLEAHGHLLGLAEGWAGWSRTLQQGVAALGQLSGSNVRLEAAAAAAAAAEQARLTAGAQLTAADAELAPLRERVAAARSALAETPGAALREQQRSLFARRDRLRTLSQLRQRLLDLVQRAEARTRAAERAREGEREARAAAAAAEEQRKQLSWMLVEAERFLEQVRADEVLTARRESLTEGHPCPLCGSTAHPWKGAPRPLAEIFQSQQQRVQDLRHQQSELALRAQQSRADADRLELEAGEAHTEAAALTGRVAELGAEWTVAAEGLALPAPADAGHALVVEGGRVQQALDEVEAALEAQARLQAALEQAEQAREAATERREAAATRLRAAEAQAEATAREQAALEAALARAAAQWQEVAAALTAPLAGVADWQETFQASPAAFVARCEEQVRQFLQARERVASSRQALEALRPRLEAARERLREREAVLRRQEAGRLERDEQLQATQARRVRLLGGQDTEAVRTALKATVGSAEQDQRSAALLRETTARRLAELSARLEGAAAEAARRVEEAAQATEALSAALAARGARLEDVQARLERSEAWVQAQQALVESARAAVTQARAVREERLEQLQRHEAADTPALSAAEAAAEQARLEAEREQARQQVYRLQGTLSADTENRRRAADTLAQRDAQRAVWERWEVVNRLIGSATGRVFSQFAQSLTLDALIIQANSHLQGLSQRYSLMRVPAEDLLIQIVDHYHGDEVRSVNSLSGGESFLVSLALALGLATLSARDTRISSLFIDEGFGTLDPDTLDVALSSLDALQASGRQVGLISHVPGMAERIGVQVQISPRGGGRSVVRVVGG